MTDRRRKPRKLPVYAAAGALFVVTFALLGVRISNGLDPRLGAPRALPPRAITVRRVIVTRARHRGRSADPDGARHPPDHGLRVDAGAAERRARHRNPRVTVIDRDPLDFAWWLASRSAGIVALLAVSASVLLGLLMANGLPRRKGMKAKLLSLHEGAAIAGLFAIAVHGVTLLGSRFVHADMTNIAIPFTLSYRPLFTGIGVLAGYLAALLGLSFYARKRIGAKLWRTAASVDGRGLGALRGPHARRGHGRARAVDARADAGVRDSDRRAVRAPRAAGRQPEAARGGGGVDAAVTQAAPRDG